MSRNDLGLIDRIILQGRALVRAIEALATIQPSGSFERALARLQPTVPAAPSSAGDEILSASEAIANNRPALRLTDNSPKLHRGSKLCRKQW